MNVKELDLFDRTLEDINVNLMYLQELAIAEFNTAFEAYRSVEQSGRNRKSLDSVLNQNYYDLHCYDMFCQHTEHLIRIHNVLQNETVVAASNVAVTPKYSILRLNRLQFEIAWARWDNSIKRIKQFLVNKATSPGMKERISQSHNNSRIMASTAKSIQMRYGMLAELCASWEQLDLLPRLDQIREFYSLPAERWVLNSYLGDVLVFPETILTTLHAEEQKDLSVDLF